MGGTTVRLLDVAAEIAGGALKLCERLHIDALLLQAYAEGRRQLPEHVLLELVDIVLEDLAARRPSHPLAAAAIRSAFREALGRGAPRAP